MEEGGFVKSYDFSIFKEREYWRWFFGVLLFPTLIPLLTICLLKFYKGGDGALIAILGSGDLFAVMAVTVMVFVFEVEKIDKQKRLCHVAFLMEFSIWLAAIFWVIFGMSKYSQYNIDLNQIEKAKSIAEYTSWGSLLFSFALIILLFTARLERKLN